MVTPKKPTGATRKSPKPGKVVTLRINPEQLTEDEADFLFYLKHKNDPRYTLDQVAKEFGYEVDRTPGRKRTRRSA
jgi:hypothetical protein